MSKKSLFFIGMLGVIFFVVPSVLGGILIDGFNPISQYISETMAIDTTYGKELRYFGYIPSGILLTTFSFLAFKKFPTSNLIKIGFIGIGLFYGIATIVVAIFPCDIGCNKELLDPSISQLIHNFTGMLTYVFVPICIILIAIGLHKSHTYRELSKIGFICGIISIALIGVLLSNPLSNYLGGYQRIIEGIFIVWIVACAIALKKRT